MNSEVFLQKVKTKVLKVDTSAEVILFGSRVRGNFTKDSDWDFLILLENPVDEELKEKIRDELFDTEIETDQVISTIIHSKSKWENLRVTPLFRNIQKEGIKI